MTRLAAPTEHDVQRSIIETLRWRGWIVIRLNSGVLIGEETATAARRFVRFADTGNDDETIPDLLAISPSGGVAWIECKRPGWRAPSPPENPLKPSAEYRRYCRQARFLERMRSRGHLALFATSIDDVDAALTERI